MGNQCKGTQSIPSTMSNPVSGLSLKEIDLIKYLWLAIYDRANLMDTGVLFFLKLFDRHPYMKSFFPDFGHESSVDMERNLDFRAHAVSVFAEISKYIDYVDTSETFEALINKRTRGHNLCGVTRSDMENMKTVILEFLEERGEGLIKLTEALEAWDKMLTAHNMIFENKNDELIKSIRQVQATEESIANSTDQSVEVVSLKSRWLPGV